ncbi:hypothetical protein CYMTET_20805 [Cymbomonas tetramitiformis]|uniref:Uncharacterized protein n=1 Tax=Cymbomonas tetramitiformis TaxID=36881 RepID=A0AAE0G4M4_9CHLO|nr:hypothetical protein CYMTET_20805 [Cymbomonas tetramitiformis]
MQMNHWRGYLQFWHRNRKICVNLLRCSRCEDVESVRPLRGARRCGRSQGVRQVQNRAVLWTGLPGGSVEDAQEGV